MTISEMSNMFDLLWNNISSNQAPGLNEYEKSQFLTLGQSDLLYGYFNRMNNKSLAGLEDNEKRQMDFSMLYRTCTPDLYNSQEFTNIIRMSVDVRYSRLSILPDDLMFIINERFDVHDRDSSVVKHLNVIPIQYGMFMLQMNKPYQWPPKNQAWRLLHSRDVVNQPSSHDVDPSPEQPSQRTLPLYASQFVELIFHPNEVPCSKGYILRYIHRPRPIITVALPDGLKINGETGPCSCELDESIHTDIVKRAVELAKATFDGNLSTIMQTYAASGTELNLLAGIQESQRQRQQQ